MARANTARLVKPMLKVPQPSPPVLLETPAPYVPAYSVAGVWGSMARADTPEAGRPVLTALQLPPPLVLLNTPALVPAAIVAGVWGSMARGKTTRSASAAVNEPA